MACWVTLGGRDCVDAGKLADALRAADPPYPTDWLPLPSRYACPVGLAPGRGHVLLLGSDLDALDLTGKLKLVMGEDALGTSVTFPNMRVVGHPRCLDFGAPDPCYLVELADRRVDLAGMTPARFMWRYNPTDRDPVCSTTTAKSWERVCRALWELLPGLGAWPGLPRNVPTPTSECVDRLDLHGYPVRDALTDCLAAVGCAATYDPIADTFGLVYFPTAEDRSALVRGKYVLIYDERPYEPKSWGTLPYYVNVLFPLWRPGRSDAEPRHFYQEPVTAPNVSYGRDVTRPKAGKMAYLQDFTPARAFADGGAIANSSTLTRRAAQVARMYFDRFRTGVARGPVRQVFSGLLNDSLVRPGETYDLVSWAVTEDGPTTAVARAGMQGTVDLYPYSTGSPPSRGKLTSFPARPDRTADGVVRRAGGPVPSPDHLKDAEGFEPDRKWVSLAGPGAGPLFKSAAALRLGDWAVAGTGAVDDHRSRLWRNRDALGAPDDMVRMVRVTGDVTYVDICCVCGSGSGSGSGGTAVYPAVVVRQDCEAEDWPEEESCYLYSANGEALERDREYLARAHPLHIPDETGSGSGCCCGSGSGSGCCPPGLRVWATALHDSCFNVVLTGKDYDSRNPWITYTATRVTDRLTSAGIVYELGEPVDLPVLHLQNVDLVVWAADEGSGGGSGSDTVPEECVHRVCKGKDDVYFLSSQPYWGFVAINGNIDANGRYSAVEVTWHQDNDEVVSIDDDVLVIDINSFV